MGGPPLESSLFLLLSLRIFPIKYCSRKVGISHHFWDSTDVIQQVGVFSGSLPERHLASRRHPTNLGGMVILIDNAQANGYPKGKNNTNSMQSFISRVVSESGVIITLDTLQ